LIHNRLIKIMFTLYKLFFIKGENT